MLPALGTLASEHSRGTQATAQALIQLMNYSATHLDATLQFYVSDMLLHINSDYYYLLEAKARRYMG